MENKGFEGDGTEKPGLNEGGDSGHVIDGSNGDLNSGEKATKVDLSGESTMADKPYPGMTKEELLRFSDTPFWNRLRLISLIVFWLGWLALLVSVVVLTITSPRCDEAPEPSWWQRTAMYQVYVRSFYDSDGDGVGDLKGITEKMEYIAGLNVGAIILSSFYQSEHTPANTPDYGYEVTDHMAIEGIYGNDADFDTLLVEAHSKGLRVIIDFIPNHTGTGHPWFVDWADGTDTNAIYTSTDCSTINNWVSVYGGSAWTDTTGTSGTCYLHQLLDSQPELNLRSAVVRERLDEVLRHWLDRGVDGFRVVGAKYLVEDADMRDEDALAGCTNPNDYNCYEHTRTASQDENFDLLSRWRAIVESYSDSDNERILLSDAKESLNNTLRYYGYSASDSANLPLNFGLIQVFENDGSCGGQCVGDYLREYMEKKPSYATSDWMFSHQDESRLTSVKGQAFANALNILRMTLPGPSIAYYGEELGMIDGDTTEWACVDPGFENGTLMIPCRDRSRTPMQWDSSPGGGFSSNGTSWIPVNPDYDTINIQALDDEDNEFSTLVQFRMLAELQNESTALQYGDMYMAHTDQNIFSFIRARDGTDRLFVIVNLGSSPSSVDYPESTSEMSIPNEAEVLVASSDGMDFVAGDMVNLWDLEIGPGQGVIFVWSYSR